MGEATFLYNPPGVGDHAHAASLLRTHDGGFLAAWYAYPEVEHRAASLVIARKAAGEDGWRQSEPLLEGGGYSAGNPVLFQEPVDRIWVLFVLLKGPYWTDAILEGACSDDGGRSWSTSMTLWQERGMMVRHPPVRLDSGLWLLPAYDERARRAILLCSSPPFLRWRVSYTFEDLPLLQPSLIREPHRLTILFRPWSDPRCIWRSHSVDDGTHWCTPIRTSVPTALSGISAFGVGDRLGVVYNHSHGQERYPLSVALSADGGVSWSGPKHVDEIPHEVSYPSFLSDETGGVHGVYTYNRRFIKYVSLDSEWLDGY